MFSFVHGYIADTSFFGDPLAAASQGLNQAAAGVQMLGLQVVKDVVLIKRLLVV